jgi:hypothetical protein
MSIYRFRRGVFFWRNRWENGSSLRVEEEEYLSNCRKITVTYGDFLTSVYHDFWAEPSFVNTNERGAPPLIKVSLLDCQADTPICLVLRRIGTIAAQLSQVRTPKLKGRAIASWLNELVSPSFRGYTY